MSLARTIPGGGGGNNNNNNRSPESVASPTQLASNVALIVPRGCRIRDEFLCPITRELIGDPVIAADGHTYDRSAIEQWIHRNRPRSSRSQSSRSPTVTSPKTGQPFEHLHLIPNHNLKRLLRDMIREGGYGLYLVEGAGGAERALSPLSCGGRLPHFGAAGATSPPPPLLAPPPPPAAAAAATAALSPDNSDDLAGSAPPLEVGHHPSVSRPMSPLSVLSGSTMGGGGEANHRRPEPRIALVRARVTSLRCLGPPESDWCGRSFRFEEPAAAAASPSSPIEGEGSSPPRIEPSPSLFGGRRRPQDPLSNAGGGEPDFVQFADATVSRKHFELRFVSESKLTGDEDSDSDNDGLGKFADFSGPLDSSSPLSSAPLSSLRRRLRSRGGSGGTSPDDRTDRVPADDNAGFFALRDLGSAGGTFVRIPPGRGAALRPGSMIMLGKHQLVAEAPRAIASSASSPLSSGARVKAARSKRDAGRNDNRDGSSSPQMTATHAAAHLDCASCPEDVLTPRYGEEGGNSGGNRAARRRFFPGDEERELTASPLAAATDLRDEMEEEGGSHEGQDEDDVDDEAPQLVLEGGGSLRLPPYAAGRAAGAVSESEEEGRSDEGEGERTLLTLRCFAPEGTPIQGRTFPLTSSGATLGRKQGNTISFSHRVNTSPDGEGGNGNGDGIRPNSSSDPVSPSGASYVGIDSSISGEHATVSYDPETKSLRLRDGVGGGGRSSTNGTWVRLSPMHRKSDWFVLEDRMEVLIGTVRFQVSMDEIVVERDIYD